MTTKNTEQPPRRMTPHEILCFLTTAGLLILAFAFAFHVDKQATQAAINAASDLTTGKGK